jgi:hypothetical protein
MFVIVTGNAFDGLALWGPWEYMEDAHYWAEHCHDVWTCVKIETPSGDWHKAMQTETVSPVNYEGEYRFNG